LVGREKRLAVKDEPVAVDVLHDADDGDPQTTLKDPHIVLVFES
jgi:hypothetical protein